MGILSCNVGTRGPEVKMAVTLEPENRHTRLLQS
jgi:hypothetical protein